MRTPFDSRKPGSPRRRWVTASVALIVAALLIGVGLGWTGRPAPFRSAWWVVLGLGAAAFVAVVRLAPVRPPVDRHPNVTRRAAISTVAAFGLVSASDRIRGGSPPAVAANGDHPTTRGAGRLLRAAVPGVSVTDFGATGDGSTDDAPAIQACIDASKPGDCIYFPATRASGLTTYLVGSDIRLAGQRSYASAMGAPGRSGVEIKYADGVNGSAVLVSASYANNSAWCGYPIHISDLRINGNRANNSSGHGVVLMNYNSRVDDCFITNCAGDGVRLSDRNAAGDVIKNTCVECSVIGNKINNCSGHGIMVLDTAYSGRLTDGYCVRNIVSKTQDHAIVINRSAGWWISQNHAYSCERDGIVVGALWNTYLVDNEVDHFGTVANGGVHSGFRVYSILDGRPSVISGNIASTREHSTDGFRYFSIRNAWDRNSSYVQFYDNKLHRDRIASPDAIGLELNPNGGELHFYEQGSMLEGLPTAINPNGTCHRYDPTGQILQFVETLDRDTIDSAASSPSPPSGQMCLTYFTANQFSTVTKLTSATRATPGAGATLAKMALYEIHPATGSGTCIARTASDPTLWQQPETAFERPIVDDGHGRSVASVRLSQGRRYAFAVLHVGSTIDPTLAGKAGVPGLIAGIGPSTRRSGQLVGHADVPESFSGSTIDANTPSGDYFYGRMT